MSIEAAVSKRSPEVNAFLATELGQLVEELRQILLRYSYASLASPDFPWRGIDPQQQPKASLATYLEYHFPDSAFTGPHWFDPCRKIDEQHDLLQSGVNCQIAAHAILELLSEHWFDRLRILDRQDRSAELFYGSTKALVKRISVFPEDWQVGDIVLLSKTEHQVDPRALHLAVVVQTNPILFFHTVATSSIGKVHTVISRIKDLAAGQHRYVAGVRRILPQQTAVNA